MATYRVYCDPDGMEELCALSPFNLKKDLKGISQDDRYFIQEEIGNSLRYGVNNPPSVVTRYWGKRKRALYSKIRVMDIARASGKSNGYRCIVLVDLENLFAFILHVYRHGHGEDKNISDKDEKMLRKLVDEYENAMNNWQGLNK